VFKLKIFLVGHKVSRMDSSGSSKALKFCRDKTNYISVPVHDYSVTVTSDLSSISLKQMTILTPPAFWEYEDAQDKTVLYYPRNE